MGAHYTQHGRAAGRSWDVALHQGDLLGFSLNLPEKCNEGAPLVVVLGHLSMDPIRAAKACGFINEAGFPTLCAVMPISASVRVVDHPRRAWAASLLEFLLTCGLLVGGRRVVLYALAHGGSLGVQQIDRLVLEDSRFQLLQERIAGVIFDSAPSFGSQAFHEMAEAYQGPGEALVGLALKAAGLLFHLTPNWWRKRFWHDMRDLQLGRTLYLYSYDTSRCDPEHIDRLIAKRQAMGAAVEWHKWPECEMWGPDYRERVLEFLRVVAQEERQPIELAFSRAARRPGE